MSNAVLNLAIAMMQIMIILLSTLIPTPYALTGHVCRRMAQETYLVQGTRAFLCNERYTTSCGHLDWRRCTKYRVQTCYGPNQRYATRYKEVEECCPGWQQSAGSCTIPVCHGLCQNGGVCSKTGSVPHCSCLPEFYGDLCQHKREKSSHDSSAPTPSSGDVSPTWILVIVIIVVLTGTLIAFVAVLLFRKRSASVSAGPTSASVSPSGTPSPTVPPTPSPSAPPPNSSSPIPTPTPDNPHDSQHPGATPISDFSVRRSKPVQPSAPSIAKIHDESSM